jgi:hypothetical protein
MNVSLAVDLIKPGLLAVAGAALLWFPHRYRQSAERRHAERSAELEAGADEAFFEERRSLDAYRPARSDRTWQLLGAVLFSLGAFQIYILLTST